jgi:uncharacterized protein
VSGSHQAATTGAAAPVLLSPTRVVLDTNVVLSLFVFADSRCTPIRAALESGKWRALTDARCLHELGRVLAYDMFGLDAAAQAAAYAAYAMLAKRVEPPVDDATPLPQCKDADDQKFLEVARDGGASLLLTSDKALLRLARRRRLAHLFRILTPDQAMAELLA